MIKINSNLFKHTSLSFVYKIASLGISYLTIPLTLNYLNAEKYGIWVTLISIVSWLTFFDMGLGNGLRHQIAVAYVNKNFKVIREYISTTYGLITGLMLLFLIISMILFPFLNWNKIFNTQQASGSELMIVSVVWMLFFTCNFIFSICNQVFYAYQKASLTGLGQLISNGSVYIAIFVIGHVMHSHNGNLVIFSIIVGVASLGSNLLMSIYFWRKHSETIPHISFFRKSRIKEISQLGLKFFIMQIAGLLVFTTSNIIITQIIGPSSVTPYTLTMKLFGFISTGFVIIITPLWSAYTDAFARNDLRWMQRMIRRLELLMLPISLVTVLLIFSFDYIMKIWIGNSIEIPFILVIAVAVYTFIFMWNNVYVYLLNGIGFINLSTIITIFVALINIPATIILTKFYGITGTVLGSIISLLPAAIFGPIQVYYLFKNFNRINMIKKIWK
jgi:O-antigen/teichoic acid export membrane protein